MVNVSDAGGDVPGWRGGEITHQSAIIGSRRLVFLTGPIRGQVVEVGGASLRVGRAPDADVMLDDPFVSRSHALVSLSGGRATVEDLHSTAGTTVNGQQNNGPIELHHCDLIQFGTIEARYEAPDEPAALPPLRREPAPISTAATRSPSGAPRFDVDRQTGGSISNVGGDQYIQQVIQERQSFARDIAATKTKARFAMWLALLLIATGMGVYFWAFFKFSNFSSFSNFSDSSNFSDNGNTELAWFHVAMAGIAVASVGMFVLIVGIVLHIVAASRRRQLLSAPRPIGMQSWTPGVDR